MPPRSYQSAPCCFACSMADQFNKYAAFGFSTEVVGCSEEIDCTLTQHAEHITGGILIILPGNHNLQTRAFRTKIK